MSPWAFVRIPSLNARDRVHCPFGRVDAIQNREALNACQHVDDHQLHRRWSHKSRMISRNPELTGDGAPRDQRMAGSRRALQQKKRAAFPILFEADTEVAYVNVVGKPLFDGESRIVGVSV